MTEKFQFGFYVVIILEQGIIIVWYSKNEHFKKSFKIEKLCDESYISTLYLIIILFNAKVKVFIFMIGLSWYP